MSFELDAYKNEENSNALFNAIMNEDIELVRSIFTNKSFKPWEYRNKDNYNALQTASFSNLYQIVKAIIDEMKKRVSLQQLTRWINSKSELGFTALHYASYKGNIDIIKILIENEANMLETNNKGLNVMHMAVQGDHPESLIYFKEKYKLNFEITDSLGSTPLHWACYTGSENAFQFMLSFENINLNVVDTEGYTPLHLSVISERVNIIKKLLQNGADKEIKDKIGRTPLELATKPKKLINIAIVEMLTEERKSCHMCVIKIPLQKLENSNFNNYLFMSFHFIVEVSVFFILMPCKINCLNI